MVNLSDPASQNAFSLEMAEECNELLNAGGFSALVFSHDSDVFCSGGHLQFYKSLNTKDQGLKVNQRIKDILNRLYELCVPKACFVKGPCYGGGIELLSCFDHIVATPSALFGFWHRRMGLVFGWGSQSRLENRMGKTTFMNELLCARTLSSFQAKRMGLIDEIQLLTKGLDSCLEWVQLCLKHGERSLSLVLQNRDEQDQVFKQLWWGKDHKEAMKNLR